LTSLHAAVYAWKFFGNSFLPESQVVASGIFRSFAAFGARVVTFSRHEARARIDEIGLDIQK
jgi:hypothetical protein